ncbi:hypothetical protein OOT46_08975 [Aquabacterium sp. A7-Y]|uniref:hypothetical protein n=1 Tax=Aquabacterium sp. A7-Y TaxID=1349605 RepID=UPI00223DA322|nr:hypothetical protein [Aquabacterium sp. A7-Y]MCW7537981.1 hypothetical protein [Aquabacterium sp. A7-Y]
MANFSTEFPIDPKNSVAEVLCLACAWVTGSPHTSIPESDLQDLPQNSERVVAFGMERVELAHALAADYEIGGLRYERTEDDLAWTTSIVTLKAPDKHLLSLQVTCEALHTAVRLPPPKKPYFIRQALEALGGGEDGEIPIADRPFRLSAGDEPIAAALILGTARNTLPIVYISAGYKDGHLVKPDQLAKHVSGMAHVVVEPSREFSYRVKALTKSRNVFGGTVGVYWPNSAARRAYFCNESVRNRRVLEVDVAKDIRVALSNRRQRTHCTWSHLKETVAKFKFDQLKAVGSTELQAYIDAFDADIAAKQACIADAEQDIARLTAEIRRLSSSDEVNEGGLLRQGEEQDLYEHEIRDIVIDAICDASRAALEGSRRQHILRDLLKANPASGARQELQEAVKSLFKTYRDMDGRTRNALARIGFDISEDGKHYKMVFQGDGRYTFALPKTTSDHRAGKNMASDINKALF